MSVNHLFFERVKHDKNKIALLLTEQRGLQTISYKLKTTGRHCQVGKHYQNPSPDHEEVLFLIKKYIMTPIQ